MQSVFRPAVKSMAIFLISTLLFIYLALPTRAGSPQQHMPITVGPFCLTHPVNFPCGRKPEHPEETHDFRQSVDFYSFHTRTGFESHWESSHWDLNLRPQRWKASALTTWPPKPLYKSSWDQCVPWKYENSAICKTIVLGKLCWSSWTGLHPAWPFPLKLRKISTDRNFFENIIV
jgi:hypothetical protein